MHILTACGGLGLFLLGMTLMTEGLKNLAGQSLRDMISRYTRTPVSGAVTGAAATAVIQSSSAVTVTAIGFVGAGLLTFTQALGIIFGANIGTTITGWVVALLGFEFDAGLLAWPVLLIAVLTLVLTNGRVSQAGRAVAGLALLLIGIQIMQQGMAQFEGLVTPAVFPNDTFVGRLQLLLIGVVITLVTQSSSAGVATAMVAMSTGAISFPQAAAMVIGMDVGTTVTAAIATIGGSTAMRQTGFAHVIYNLMTGVMAFALLGPYTTFVAPYISAGVGGSAQMAVVGFHTFFNTLGVILVLPFTGVFARFIMRSVPTSSSAIAHRLDIVLLGETPLALDAIRQTVSDIRAALYNELVRILSGKEGRGGQAFLSSVDQAIEETLSFVDQLKSGDNGRQGSRRTASALHALDHLSRLSHRLRQVERSAALEKHHRLGRLKRMLFVTLQRHQEEESTMDADYFDRLRQMMRVQRGQIRRHTIRHAATNSSDWRDVMIRLDSARWLHRISYHIWRIEYHLEQLHHDGAGHDRG